MQFFNSRKKHVIGSCEIQGNQTHHGAYQQSIIHLSRCDEWLPCKAEVLRSHGGGTICYHGG